MDKQQKQSKVLEGHSPVNKYELLCLEKGGTDSEVNEERILVAFQAMEELIPHLGVYTKIFMKLKDDLHGAVYSDELTTHGEDIQKVPYFTLVHRVYSERHQKTDELTDQLETVKKRLFEKHKQFEDSQQKIAELEDTIEKLNQHIDELDETVVDKNSEIDRLEQELTEEKESANVKQKSLEGDVEALQESLAEAKQEIEFLSKFKKGYDDLYIAFLDTSNEDDSIQKKKKPIVSTKRANLINNIEASTKLEEQIMAVLNTAVEEFDKFMEEHKGELQHLESRDDMTDAEYDLQEMEIEQVDQQLEVTQERFKQTVGDITNELNLLKQHNIMLMEQLQVLEQNKPTITKKKQKMPDPQGLAKSDSILSAGLGDDEEEDADMDPFIPQERVFSKYAAMVYTSSNQGKSYDEFKEAKFCASCGEKTVVCPHKLPGEEKTFLLPHNCTHIKIVRPKVRVNKQIINAIMKPTASPEVTWDLLSTVGSRSMMASRDQGSFMGRQGYEMTPATMQDSPSVMGSEAHMLHSIHRVFDDFRERTQIERNISRPLPLDRTISILEQFWTYMIWQDENASEEDGFYSILDCIYTYMQERYLVEEIMYLCAFDFLSAVAEHSSTSKTIQMMAHVLAGNLDGATFRYMLLMCDFICSVEWMEVEDFRAFAAAVYPFLGEDDLETLQMSYTSFSENKISDQLVANFIIHMILKYREPRFQEMENRLLPFQTQEYSQPQLNEREFKESMDSILPLTNDKLRKRLFLEAEKAVRMDGTENVVPIMRLAQISGYLGLLQIAHLVKDTVASRVVEWRNRPNSAGETGKSHVVHDTQLSVSEERLITMSTIKTLVANISRRSKHRHERLEQQSEASW